MTTPKKQKTHENHKIDLSVGQPSLFLNYIPGNQHDNNTYYYPDSVEYYLKLSRKLIAQLHDIAGNDDCRGKKIVFAVGASQLISAAGYAMARKYGCTVGVCPQTPVWPRVPALFNLGIDACQHAFRSLLPLDAVPTPPVHKLGFILVSPSNPDGAISKHVVSGPLCYDTCYNWPFYTKRVKKYDSPICIYSAAKALGVPGIRMGWATVSDPDLARYMEEYVELTTIGISKPAVKDFNKILTEWALEPKVGKQYIMSVQKALANRRKLVKKATKEHNLSNFIQLNVKNKEGMYAWIEATSSKKHNNINQLKHYVESTLGLKVLWGDYFFDKPNRFRLNLCGDDKDFKMLIKRLCNAKTNKTRAR